MKYPSPQVQEWLEQIHKVPSFWDRFIGNTNKRIHLIQKVENAGEPEAIISLLQIVFDPDRETATAAAKAIHNLLQLVTSSSKCFHETDWFKEFYEYFAGDFYISKRQVDQIANFGEYSVSLLGIASFNKSGHIRERAVRLISDYRNGFELPFLIYRMNDWVKPVREQAYLAMRNRLTADYAPHYIKNLNLVLQLNEWHRNNHGPIVTDIIQLVQRPEYWKGLKHIIANAPTKLKRSIYDVVLDNPHISKKLIEMSSHEKDPVSRLIALKTARKNLTWEQLEPLLLDARQSNYTPLRREAFITTMEKEPRKDKEYVYETLFDSNRTLRDFARFYYNPTSKVETAELYRQKIQSGNIKTLPGAIEGLGDIGTQNDSELIIPFLKHSALSVRKAAVWSISKLTRDQYSSLFLQMLNDPQAGVEREAYIALKKYPNSITISALKNSFDLDTRKHSRKRIINMIGQRNKWESIIFLLTIAASNDVKLSDHVQTVIESWVRRGYRLPMPTPLQTEEIFTLINMQDIKLESRIIKELKYLISTWDK